MAISFQGADESVVTGSSALSTTVASNVTPVAGWLQVTTMSYATSAATDPGNTATCVKVGSGNAFTQLDREYQNGAPSGDDGHITYVWYRTLTGAEPSGASDIATLTFTNSSFNLATASSVIYSGTDPVPAAPVWVVYDTDGAPQPDTISRACARPVSTRTSALPVYLGIQRDGSGGGGETLSWVGATERTEAITNATMNTSVADGPAVADGVTAGAVSFRKSPASAERMMGAATIMLPPLNVAPNAPTTDSPASGAVIDRALDLRLNWTFSDNEPSDVQSKYDVQLRPDGGATTVDTTGTTADSFHDVTGGTIVADGEQEWRVRTYDEFDLVGAWSAWSPFTAATQPVAPVITDPTDGQTIPTATYAVVWTSSVQERYQVRTVADDGAGSPNTATVYTDTGEITSAVVKTTTVAFDTNSRDEHVQVRIYDDGLWSTYDTHAVTVDYDTPAVPTTVVTADTPTAAITIGATHPTPTGDEPTVTTMDIFRRVTADGGDGIRVAAGVAPDGSHIDYLVASGVDYGYRVRAFGDNGTSIYSSWVV